MSEFLASLFKSLDTVVLEYRGERRFHSHTDLPPWFIEHISPGAEPGNALLSGYLLRFIISCSGVFQPRLAALAGKNQPAVLTNAIMKYSTMVSNVAAGIALAGVFVCKDFLALWLPENFEGMTYVVMLFY